MRAFGNHSADALWCRPVRFLVRHPQNRMNHRGICVLSIAATLVACQGEPRLVYVPLTETKVELLVRASATEVSVGEPVILRAERWTHGEWKQVEKSSLTPDQCWLGRPPPTQEAEVSDNVHWEAIPAGRARFNTAYRVDRTREVVFLEAGTFTLESSSAIWCSSKSARGRQIRIVVRDPMKPGATKP